MMCYKDMTFCEFKDCKFFSTTCPRSLTEEVKKESARLGLLIAKFIDKPSCYEHCVLTELKNKMEQSHDSSN